MAVSSAIEDRIQRYQARRRAVRPVDWEWTLASACEALSSAPQEAMRSIDVTGRLTRRGEVRQLLQLCKSLTDRYGLCSVVSLEGSWFTIHIKRHEAMPHPSGE